MKKIIARIKVFRHGISKYRQGKVSIVEANDLTTEGIEGIIESVEAIFSSDYQSFEIILYSSPLGRALHSTKVISRALEARGIRNKIYIRNELQEVKNFSWPPFIPLITGGKVSFKGKTFYIKKEHSNPKCLKYPEYFMLDCINDITNKVLALWPEEYVKLIKSFETFESASNRMILFLNRLKNDYSFDNDKKFIIVTHDTLLNKLADLASGGEQKSISPGEHIGLLIGMEEISITLKNYPTVVVNWRDLLINPDK